MWRLMTILRSTKPSKQTKRNNWWKCKWIDRAKSVNDLDLCAEQIGGQTDQHRTSFNLPGFFQFFCFPFILVRTKWFVWGSTKIDCGTELWCPHRFFDQNTTQWFSSAIRTDRLPTYKRSSRLPTLKIGGAFGAGLNSLQNVPFENDRFLCLTQNNRPESSREQYRWWCRLVSRPVDPLLTNWTAVDMLSVETWNETSILRTGIGLSGAQ